MDNIIERKQILRPIRNINRVLLLCIISFFLVGSIISIIIPYITSNKEVSIFMLEITTYIAFCFPMLIFLKLKLNGSNDFILPKFNLKTIKYGIVCAIIAYPLMIASIYFAKKANINSAMTNKELESTMVGFSLLGNIIRMALLPAVAEELVFRSGLLGVYSKKNVLAGIFLSSIVFTLLHGNLYQMPYAFVGGVVFAYTAYITDNVGISMVAHFLVNLVSVIELYVTNIANKYIPGKTSTLESIFIGLSMMCGVLMSGYLLLKIHKKQITPKSLRLNEESLKFGSFVTLSLVFVISILLLITFLYEGYVSTIS